MVLEWRIQQWKHMHACVLLSLNRTSLSFGLGMKWNDSITRDTLSSTCGPMEKLRTHKINLHSDHCDLWQKGINKARTTTVVPFYLVHLLKGTRKAGCSRIRLFHWEEETTLTQLHCRTTLTQLWYRTTLTHLSCRTMLTQLCYRTTMIRFCTRTLLPWFHFLNLQCC